MYSLTINDSHLWDTKAHDILPLQKEWMHAYTISDQLKRISTTRVPVDTQKLAARPLQETLAGVVDDIAYPLTSSEESFPGDDYIEKTWHMKVEWSQKS